VSQSVIVLDLRCDAAAELLRPRPAAAHLSEPARVFYVLRETVLSFMY
jgi:hypothetical protein